MQMAIEQQEEQSTGLSNGILGMLFLLTTEFMFFAGLISAFVVNTAKEPVWPPMGQPRLPIEVTAINTIILLFSGITFFSFY
ncbi:MAG: cytochrome c oxidase subunit 3, partial [Chitinophagales bacterium]